MPDLFAFFLCQGKHFGGKGWKALLEMSFRFQKCENALLTPLLCVLSFLRHGRQHTIMPSKVNYQANIWALKEEGCTHVIVTTACGSLKEEIQPGDIIIIDQFIDR